MVIMPTQDNLVIKLPENPTTGYEWVYIIDDFEVVLVDWPSEIAYTHEVFYSGVDVKYVTG